MSDFLYCVGLIFLGGYLGIGIRWGFWICDNISEMLHALFKWLHNRRKR